MIVKLLSLIIQSWKDGKKRMTSKLHVFEENVTGSERSIKVFFLVRMFLVENNFVFLLKVIRLNNRVKKISTDSKKERKKKKRKYQWKKKTSSFYQSRHLTTKQREINVFFLSIVSEIKKL